MKLNFKMILNNIIINVPKNIKIIIWKKNKNCTNIISLKHSTKQINLNCKLNIFVDKWSNSLIFLKKNNNCVKLKLENSLNMFLNSINLYFFKKIKFKGKGFRIKFFKKIKLIKFYFGKSHKTFILLKKLRRKRINKYKFMVYSINKYKNINISKKITNIRNINFYTLRGLRTSRSIIFKRKGKKGTYI